MRAVIDRNVLLSGLFWHDDEVLALALAARVDLIISGDEDLLSLGNYAGIAIVDATEGLRIVTSA